MPEFKDLIKKRRLELGKTLEEVGTAMGVSKATVQRWESGEIKDMRRSKLVDLARALDTTPSYLMGWEEASDLPAGISPLPKMKSMPVVGTIACGTPILAEQNIEEYVSVPDSVRADFSLRCRGDSMIEARIYDGDLVFIREQPDVENGEIAAVMVDDETATLKRVVKQHGQIILMPANSKYIPQFFVGSDMARVRIIGKAVSFLSDVR